MNFKPYSDVNGTSFQGEFEGTYDEIVEIFGNPHTGPNDANHDKVTCSWCIRFADGTVATIYDWKEEATPTGPYRWHIGGNSPRAAQLILEEWEVHHF